MSKQVQLEPHEEELRKGIEALLARVKRLLPGRTPEIGEEIRRDILEMGDLAHELHTSLLRREADLEPRHHAYMVENRGFSPRHPEFYRHVHPVEDLLAFLKDPDANDDPIDQTLGVQFEFPVYSRRWGHDDIYSVRRTGEGWEIEHMGHGGPCDRRGEPFLYENFRKDLINYPARLPDYVEELWRLAEDAGLSPETVQEALSALGNWVSQTERATPSLRAITEADEGTHS